MRKLTARNGVLARWARRAPVVSTRAAFALLEHLGPSIGGLWAERLWFTVPPRARRPNRREGQGRRIELSLHGHRMVAEAWGEGPPIFLMHGWGGRRGDLRAFVKPLVSVGYRVVALDGPGHGESENGPAGPGRATILEFSEALAILSAQEGPAHAVIAHSLGCMATAVAVRDGLVASRLVFLAPMAQVAPYTLSLIHI